MESETIDLTDPLEQLLRETGWTPEYLQERLSKITKDNTGESDENTRIVKNMTLANLLEGFPCSRTKVSKVVEAPVTIELSDDDDEGDVFIINETENENEEVTEVRVIEVDDDSSQSDHNEDDDEFLEEPRDGTIRSNDEVEFDHIDDRSVSTDSTPNESNIPTIDHVLSENIEEKKTESNTSKSGKEKLRENIEISVDNRIVGEENLSSETSTIEEGIIRKSCTNYLLQSELFDDDQTHDLGFKVSNIQGGITLIDSPSEFQINMDNSENFDFIVSSVQGRDSLIQSPSPRYSSINGIDNIIENNIPADIRCEIGTHSCISITSHSNPENIEDISKISLAQENAIEAANHSIHSVAKNILDSETKCDEEQMDPLNSLEPEKKSSINDISMVRRCKNNQRNSFHSEIFDKDNSTRPLVGETNICSKINNTFQNDCNINVNLNMDDSSMELSTNMSETMKTCDANSDSQCHLETVNCSKKNYQSKSIHDLQNNDINDKPLIKQRNTPNKDLEPENESIIPMNKNYDNSVESSKDNIKCDNSEKYGSPRLEEKAINGNLKEISGKKENAFGSIGAAVCKVVEKIEKSMNETECDLGNAQEYCMEPFNADSNKSLLIPSHPSSSKNDNSSTETLDNTPESLDKVTYSPAGHIPVNNKVLQNITSPCSSRNSNFCTATTDSTPESLDKVNYSPKNSQEILNITSTCSSKSGNSCTETTDHFPESLDKVNDSPTGHILKNIQEILNITSTCSSKNSNSGTETTDDAPESSDKVNYFSTGHIPENSQEVLSITSTCSSKNSNSCTETTDDTPESLDKVNDSPTDHIFKNSQEILSITSTCSSKNSNSCTETIDDTPESSDKVNYFSTGQIPENSQDILSITSTCSSKNSNSCTETTDHIPESLDKVDYSPTVHISENSQRILNFTSTCRSKNSNSCTETTDTPESLDKVNYSHPDHIPKNNQGLLNIIPPCASDNSNFSTETTDTPQSLDKVNYSPTGHISENSQEFLNLTSPLSSKSSNSYTETTGDTPESLDKVDYSSTGHIPGNNPESCDYIPIPRINLTGIGQTNSFAPEKVLENESVNKVYQMDVSKAKDSNLESGSCKSSLGVLSGLSKNTEFMQHTDLEKSKTKKSTTNIVEKNYNEPISGRPNKVSSSKSLFTFSETSTLSTANIVISGEALNEVESSGPKKTYMESLVADTRLIISNEPIDRSTDCEENSTLKNVDSSFGTDKELHENTKDDAQGDQDHDKEEHSVSNLEEIRTNLKLQLTQLRNRKRMDILHNSKDRDVNLAFSKSSIFSENKPDISLELAESAVGAKKIRSKHTQERTNADETSANQQMIAIITPFSKISEPEITTEKQEEEEIPNVLQEIRNIIKKQRSTAKAHSYSINPYNNSVSADKEVYQNSEKSNISTSNHTIDDKGDSQIIPASSLADRPQPTSNNLVNSPFVSNSLDKFLTDAKLNVSYVIPKSGAEEGLRQNYSEEPVMPLMAAEIKEENTAKITQETKYKPKTLAEKRRLLEKIKIKEKKHKERLKKLEDAQKRSYVLYKDKKIFLKAKSRGICIASIDSLVPVPKSLSIDSATPKKPSLLTELYKKAFTPPKYKPGPLCKKHLLQSDYSNWTTELKTLPRIILEVMPELGKPLHPNLFHILPKWDGDVSENQIEFALSAVFSKKEQKQNHIFKFDVAYENHQTQILTRRKISDKPIFKFEGSVLKKEYSSSHEDEIAEVVEKLLNYVEIKEMEPTLIKEDENFSTICDDPLDTVKLTMDNHVLVKRKSRFTKTDRELLRLNCKVVSVEVEDSEPQKMCSKPYCRLGCICKSLNCEKIIGLHCQKAKCIFGCTCPKEKDKIISISEPTMRFPAGTDLLSTATVNRIEGEAKRNLARVEKEFTQTVIHTNDKTIVVGFGSKPRRATKTPKKYIDFFDDEVPKEDSKEEKKDLLKILPCYVHLERGKFSDIIPYCLVHRLYSCHCRGLSSFSSNIFKSSTKEEKNTNMSLNKYKKSDDSLVKERNLNSRSKVTAEESFKAIVRKSAVLERNADDENDSEEILYSVTGRPLRKKKKVYEADFIFDGEGSAASRKHSESESLLEKPQLLEDSESSQCTRTQEIDSKYYRKIRTFSNAVFACDFVNNLTQADLVRAEIQKNDDNISEADFLRRYIMQERNNQLKQIEIEIHKKKRKQKIQVRRDEDRIKIKKSGKLAVAKTSASKHKVKSVFKGEIIVNESEWLKKLGQNTKQPLEGYARILPWSALLKGFLSKSLNIYCLSDIPLRLLLNVGPKLTGEKLMDVETRGYNIINSPLRVKTPWLLKQSENVRDIIRWLLSGTLPLKYKNTSLSFLLVETLPDQFEVRGLCTQEENKQGHESNKADLPEEGEIMDQVTEVKHKNMNNDVQSLFITKAKFRLRELVEDGVEDDLTDNLYMWVGLPEVYKVAKWRVIILKNDFSYLYFKKIKYSIKYTDLSKLIQMAKVEMLTLIIRNVQIRRNYDHASFGLYISHNYTDRIFIGPYFVNYDEDDIETLRYINQSLVSSESFNKMTGNPNHRCGHWMYERKYYHTPKVHLKDTIDLTKNDSPRKAPTVDLKPIPSVSTSSISVASSVTSTNCIVSSHAVHQNISKDEHVIYHNGMSILIKNSKPRSPAEFNRFIITNIPHFGYLGAYQPDNSPTLEVSWPFEKKVLQFQNADSARDFLQERFNQLLQPVPESFKIQVIVLLQLDLTEHQPINSDFLSGHCICGYFGTYNFKDLTPEFCLEKFNISKEEITKLFAKRAHAYIRKKIEELAEIVGISQNNPIDFNVPSILDKAREEIKLQENIRKQQISEIHSCELQAVSKIRRLHGMVKNLPLKERNVESKIITEILQIRPNRITRNEIVEIKDDDEPDQSQKVKSNPVLNNTISADTQLIKNPLKRGISDNESVQKAKVAKDSSYVGPSKSMSILKVNQQPRPKLSCYGKTIVSTVKKQNVLIVRPHQPNVPPVITIEDDIEKEIHYASEDKSADTCNTKDGFDISQFFVECDYTDTNETNTTEIIPQLPLIPESDRFKPKTLKTYSKKSDASNTTILHISQQSENT